MFASTITINDNAAVARNFKQVAIEPQGSVRIDDSTNNVAPRKMAIRHSVYTPKGSTVPVDRHLLQFSVTKLDTENEPQTAVLNYTLSVPRSSAIAQADVDHLMAFAKNWLATGSNGTGLLLGES